MLYFVQILALLLSTPLNAQAARIHCPAEWAKLARVYTKSHGCDYSSGSCYENALKLARRLLAEPEIDPDHLQVVYIFPGNKATTSIYARGARGGSEEWRYHVLVVYKGQVMDHDHGKTAVIKSAADYIEDMFEKDIPDSAMIEGQHLFEPRSDAKLRIIPAKDYVEQTAKTHSGQLDFRFYIRDPKGLYPAMQIQDFLQRFGE